MAIHSSKAQFLLATSKPNSYWQYQNPIFFGTTLSKRKKPKIIKSLAKEKIYYVVVAKKGPWQSLMRAILRIMLSYYKPMKYMDIICNIEFIKVNIIYKSILKLVLLFQTIQLIAQRPIASIYEKPKNITNKNS